MKNKNPGISVLTFDFPSFLKKLTGYKGWKETDGPDSHCGIDYWYKTTDEDGDRHNVYINIDQGEMTVSTLEDDEVIYQGNCSKAYAKGKK
jgi:hypothetical protein